MILLDKMILSKRLAEFVRETIKVRNDELIDNARWEFWLHRVFDMSFEDYLAKVDSKVETMEQLPDVALEATVRDSMEMINSFCPF